MTNPTPDQPTRMTKEQREALTSPDDTPTRAEAIRLLHIMHRGQWDGRSHRCRVGGCSGLVGEPTDGPNIWTGEGPPRKYHARGRAVDFRPTLDRYIRPGS